MSTLLLTAVTVAYIASLYIIFEIIKATKREDDVSTFVRHYAIFVALPFVTTLFIATTLKCLAIIDTYTFVVILAIVSMILHAIIPVLIQLHLWMHVVKREDKQRQ